MTFSSKVVTNYIFLSSLLCINHSVFCVSHYIMLFHENMYTTSGLVFLQMRKSMEQWVLFQACETDSENMTLQTTFGWEDLSKTQMYRWFLRLKVDKFPCRQRMLWTATHKQNEWKFWKSQSISSLRQVSHYSWFVQKDYSFLQNLSMHFIIPDLFLVC